MIRFILYSVVLFGGGLFIGLISSPKNQPEPVPQYWMEIIAEQETEIKILKTDLQEERARYKGYVLQDLQRWEPVWAILQTSNPTDTVCFIKQTNNSFKPIK